MKLVNTLRQFIETTDQRRLAEYVRLNGTGKGYQQFTAYRLGKETKISLNTIYKFLNNPDEIPSSVNLKKICETYLIQPNEIVALVEK